MYSDYAQGRNTHYCSCLMPPIDNELFQTGLINSLFAALLNGLNNSEITLVSILYTMELSNGTNYNDIKYYSVTVW